MHVYCSVVLQHVYFESVVQWYRLFDSSGRKVSENGLEARVVTDLQCLFKGSNHVCTCMDNYQSSAFD